MQSNILQGDVLAGLGTLAAGSVQTCVTSPPYFGLRDYGTAKWDGGADGCDHTGEPMRTKAAINANCGTGLDRKNAEARQFYRDLCGKCGARRVDDQIGLEPTPDEYVARLVAVFREVRRVLADDGTLWLNLGDSYANNPSTSKIPRAEQSNGTGIFSIPSEAHVQQRRTRANALTELKRIGLKHKDLIGIPWRVAFALQADGWYLRQDIIWHKPNPMPESVRDRCTKAHEYLFLLSKSPRYFYDADAVKEPAQSIATGNTWQKRKAQGQPIRAGMRPPSTSLGVPEGGRNRRSVWTITPKPFRGAHFAVMPEALVEPCLLAGSRPGDLVLDTFCGSGTVGVVARRHGRAFVGCELNPEYAAMARTRIAA